MKINFLNNIFNYKNNISIKKIKKYIIISGIILTMPISSDINAKEKIEEYSVNENVRIENNYNNIDYKKNQCFSFSFSDDLLFQIRDMQKKVDSLINNTIEQVKREQEQENAIEKKLVAITFDDGPGIYTERLLDILEENNAKATFFVIGTGLKRYGDIVKRAYDSGNEIAIHGYTHTSFTELTIDEIQNEITTVSDLLIDLNITPSNLVRPPYGSIDDTIEKGLDYSFIKWSVDTRDWESLNKDAIKKQIRNNIEEGAIILMHDTHETTIDAVEEILPELIDEYEFVTVDELFEKNNQELEIHKSYRKVKVLEKVEE